MIKHFFCLPKKTLDSVQIVHYNDDIVQCTK
nr:MAG TPA: hypothetical protein [Caudoviricetes sp.]